MAACSAAIVAADGTEPVLLARVWEDRPRGHAEVLMSRIEQVMDEASLGFPELDRIAVTVGPGTFTGVRIGVATARGMALALGIDVAGVTTLEAIARGAHACEPACGRPLCVALDARRGELYVQCFDVGLGSLSEPAALLPDEAAALARRHDCLVVGTGASIVREAAGTRGPDCAADLPKLPDAVHVALAAAGRPFAAAPPEPLYLRAPDAKLPAS
jgi:tRNA threonylcarbamoyladenosine biosynthesis protein TsaB